MSNTWNANISRMAALTANVIIWGVGYNTVDNKKLSAALDVEKFKLISIRDHNHESRLPWVPCVSCKAPEFSKVSEVKRSFGIIEHHKIPIKGGNIKELAGARIEKITNSYTIDEITDFIASTEVVVTNTYHIVYFSQLMEKKVICINPFSTKFDYFKYKPMVLHGKFKSAKIESAASKQTAPTEGVLNEAISLNDAFFLRVKEVVEDVIKEPGNEYSLFYNTKNGGVGSIRSDLMELRERTKIKNIFSRMFRVFNKY
jgi:hypothetical protein